MKLEAGQTFKSIPIGLDKNIEILSISEIKNEIEVRVNNVGINQVWNLQHCIWAFERGEYILNLEVNKKYIRGNKNDQLEDDGAYAD